MVAKPSKNILFLENGDRLTRAEFERRYQAMPHLKKAELIEGKVYMGSPVRRIHGQPHSYIMAWLGVYHAATPGTDLADNTTVRLDADNEPQPDALLRLEVGNSQVDEDDYIAGAPELIVEIATSSAAYDLREKLQVYRRNGVREYIVWQVSDRLVDWFFLQEEKYIKFLPDSEGIVKSQVFPGLWLTINSLLDNNLAEVLQVVQQGLASVEHEQFIAELNI
ncbi:Uma2 family endonuclease [Myxosarcina sp. GI1(2024)]